MPNTDIDLRAIAKEQVAIRRNLEDINLSLKQIAQYLCPITEGEMMSEAITKFMADKGYLPNQFVIVDEVFDTKEDPK